MAVVNTFENSLLLPVYMIIDSISEMVGRDAKMESLIYVASRYSGVQYHNEIDGIEFSQNEYQLVKDNLINLYQVVNDIKVPVPLALCSLAREQLSFADQKKNGVYYTDFRIAEYMAGSICESILPCNSIVDTAAGTGILLTAVALKSKEKWKKEDFSYWIKKNVYAVDMSESALRGIQIAFLSLINDIDDLIKLRKHLYLDDSLLGAFSQKKKKFDYIIGNPPWGKIKLSRHMFAKSLGVEHIYGSEFEDFKNEHYDKEKQILTDYSNQVKEKFKLIGSGEIDLYMPFFENAMNRVSNCGKVVILVPAGLIRAQGTENLRRFLFEKFGNIKVAVFDNKDRYFAIDTRFKFLCVEFEKAGAEIRVSLPQYTGKQILDSKSVVYTKQNLKNIRADYSIPELYTEDELNIFEKMVCNGTTEFDKGIWKMDIAREVDMTSSSKYFQRSSRDGLPVIEGRMVNNFRIGAKSYISGQGRSAVWKTNKIGSAVIKPQFVIAPSSLPESIKIRTTQKRAGFCDIAGQTNERAMMSAIIPDGVVCGNKVPTVIFPNIDKGIYAWVGVTNSFVYDWFLRRVLTTTVNYFLLKSIPIPAVDPGDNRLAKIIENVKQLELLDSEGANYDKYENLRSENDVLVAKLYGITGREMRLILEDFNLLDRGQPAIEGEVTSTITRDMILKTFGDLDVKYYDERVKKAKSAGAIAYINAELQREMR